MKNKKIGLFLISDCDGFVVPYSERIAKTLPNPNRNVFFSNLQVSCQEDHRHPLPERKNSLQQNS